MPARTAAVPTECRSRRSTGKQRILEIFRGGSSRSAVQPIRAPAHRTGDGLERGYEATAHPRDPESLPMAYSPTPRPPDSPSSLPCGSRVGSVCLAERAGDPPRCVPNCSGAMPSSGGLVRLIPSRTIASRNGVRPSSAPPSAGQPTLGSATRRGTSGVARVGSKTALVTSRGSLGIGLAELAALPIPSAMRRPIAVVALYPWGSQVGETSPSGPLKIATCSTPRRFLTPAAAIPRTSAC